jgi:2-dehydro-3-deoxyglucarate aldolase/4-hydroxy-2-oxoheptanedioate aldolase
MRINKVKQALKRGELQIGCLTSQFRNAEVVRVLAAAGLHWTFIDAEHGAYGQETLNDLTRAAVLAGLCPLVRVADLQYALIARALDCGAQGVILPRVESREVVERAVSWTRYPPMGTRGFGLGAPHLEYEAVTIADALTHTNEQVMVVVQIETRTALERLDDILSVPHIDAVMIGPADLSVSLGVAGQFDHPEFVAAVEQICESCRRHGVVPGMHLRTLALATTWRDRGVLLLSCNSDVGFLFDKAAETVAALARR